MKENFKHAIDVSVPFAFWTFIFSLIFGGLGGIGFGIVEAWGRFPGIGDFIFGSGFYAMMGALIGFNIFLYVGLPTALVIGLLIFTGFTYFRLLPYGVSIFALVIVGVWSSQILDDFMIADLIGHNFYIFLAVNIVTALSLFGAAIRINRNSSRKSKVKRGE